MAAQVFTVDYEFPSFIIRASDILTGQPINELKLSVLPQSVCVSPRGDCIALATQRGTMLLDPVSLTSAKTLATGDTTAVTYSPSEPLLVAGRMDSKLAWFSFPDIGQAPAVHDTCVPGVVRTVCFTLSGNTLAAGMSSGGLVIIVDADSRQNTKVIETLISTINSVAFLSECSIAVGGRSQVIQVFNVESGVVEGEVNHHTNSIQSIVVSRDLSMFALGTTDSAHLTIYDAATYTTIKKIRCSGAVTSVFFVDTHSVIVGVKDAPLIAMSIESGKVEQQFVRHSSPSAIAVFVPSKLGVCYVESADPMQTRLVFAAAIVGRQSQYVE